MNVKPLAQRTPFILRRGAKRSLEGCSLRTAILVLPAASGAYSSVLRGPFGASQHEGGPHGVHGFLPPCLTPRSPGLCSYPARSWPASSRA